MGNIIIFLVYGGTMFVRGRDMELDEKTEVAQSEQPSCMGKSAIVVARNNTLSCFTFQ